MDGLNVEITCEQRRGLNIALNEAKLLGFEVDPSRRLAGATFSVLTLPEHGPPPSDGRIQMIFHPIGRVTAFFWRRVTHAAVWKLKPFRVEELLRVVEDVGMASLYGWNFFDVEQPSPRPAEQTPSLDWECGPGGCAHSITIFPRGELRITD
jgi:hypothetical protein